MLTGEVDVSLDVNGNLVLTGDTNDNFVLVTKAASGGQQLLVAGGRSTPSDPNTITFVNGATGGLVFNAPGGVIFNMDEGNDHILFTNVATVGAFGSLGPGNDSLVLQSSSSGPTTFTLNDGTSPTYGKVSTSDIVTCNGDDGVDSLVLYNATIAGNLTFDGGNGNDLFNSTGTSPSNNVVGGSVQISPGGGNDTTNVSRMSVGGNFRIDDGYAVSQSVVSLRNLHVNLDVLLNLSIRQDLVTLAGEDSTAANRFGARNVTINTGDGFDRVTVNLGTMVNLTVATGAGDEVNGSVSGINLTNLNINNAFSLDTGDGTNTAYFNFITAKTVAVQGGGGNDSIYSNHVTASSSTASTYDTGGGDDLVALHDSQYVRLTVTLDDGDDRMQVRSVTVTTKTTFNGGLGVNKYTDQGSNSLANLTKSNF
jgi:hypothetical protein